MGLLPLYAIYERLWTASSGLEIDYAVREDSKAKTKNTNW